MTEERTLLNELRLINIALKRGMSAVCGEGPKVPNVSDMVLNYIFMRGGNVPQKDVESEFNLRRSTASEILGRLEQENLITRATSEEDGRSKRIFLSERARAVQCELADKFRAVENYLESALTAAERKTFFELCGKIRGLLEMPHGSK